MTLWLWWLRYWQTLLHPNRPRTGDMWLRRGIMYKWNGREWRRQ